MNTLNSEKMLKNPQYQYGRMYDRNPDEKKFIYNYSDPILVFPGMIFIFAESLKFQKNGVCCCKIQHY